VVGEGFKASDLEPLQFKHASKSYSIWRPGSDSVEVHTGEPI
jgi:hypothetical protein